jgi:hypothetical protein
VFRDQKPFNPQDLTVGGTGNGLSYDKFRPGRYPDNLIELLKARQLPPIAVGDLVILEVGETTAAARIINSRQEIHLGDLVVKR